MEYYKTSIRARSSPVKVSIASCRRLRVTWPGRDDQTRRSGSLAAVSSLSRARSAESEPVVT